MHTWHTDADRFTFIVESDEEENGYVLIDPKVVNTCSKLLDEVSCIYGVMIMCTCDIA